MCKCGEKHIEPIDIYRDKHRLNYSWNDMGRAMSYSGYYVRSIAYGKNLVRCRFNLTYRLFQKQAVPLPSNRGMDTRKVNAITKEGGLRNYRRRDKKLAAFISTKKIMLSWRWFKCKGCGEWWIGSNNQLWCRGKVCVGMRKDGGYA